MANLYFDDIESKAYTDAMILEDLRALVKSGQREGPLLDYKSDLSPKDNWPSTVAAFANTFGGLIVFGVEGKNDQPCRLTGFDPNGVEVKTKLKSMVIDRIYSRPDFSVRVVTHDQDPKREITLLRITEGRNPPYMHSKEGEHRIYIRMGAQKTEADYLQLSSLIEKRERTESQAFLSPAELFGPDSQLSIPRPVHSNQVSPIFLSLFFLLGMLAPGCD
jgi:predicted HTH transcriptional regulator